MIYYGNGSMEDEVRDIVKGIERRVESSFGKLEEMGEEEGGIDDVDMEKCWMEG